MTEDFEERLQALRPRLHRYCARLTGSTFDGEDAVQDSMVKALRARAEGAAVVALEPWLLRIAHNTCLDLLRQRARQPLEPLADDLDCADDAAAPDVDLVALSFRTFARLPELQRCAVILKDVLGHSVEEIAAVAGCSPAAAKSALQRGRKSLKLLAATAGADPSPVTSDPDWQRTADYVRLFQDGAFDAIRARLAEDVKLELVNRLRLAGRAQIGHYFHRYAAETKWRFGFGTMEGRPAMLVFDACAASDRPAHVVLIEWEADRIVGIRDFLFAPYVVEQAEWRFHHLAEAPRCSSAN